VLVWVDAIFELGFTVSIFLFLQRYLLTPKGFCYGYVHSSTFLSTTHLHSKSNKSSKSSSHVRSASKSERHA